MVSILAVTARRWGDPRSERDPLRRDPFEELILGRVEKRLRKYLARGGEAALRRFITEEIVAKVQDPREEIAKVRAELAGFQTEADRLLDIATPASRDFVEPFRG